MSEKPFLVISSFNNSGMHLTKYGSGYKLLDQSNIAKWEVENRMNGATKANHVGHDLNNILNYIVENYDQLPQKIAFLKANVIGRHCTEEYLENNITNDFYTNFYHDPDVKLQKKVNDVPFPGNYLEANDPWYVTKENHKLFCSLDQLGSRIFEKYKPGKFVSFGPGACFVIPKKQILRHPKELYSVLSMISSYQFFPDEAFIVERILPMIFTSGYRLRQDVKILEKELIVKLEENNHQCSNVRTNFSIKRKLTKIAQSIFRIE